MTRLFLTALSGVALPASAPVAFAAPCKDAKGQFIKCPTAKIAKVTYCRLQGKFVKCGTPGSKPA